MGFSVVAQINSFCCDVAKSQEIWTIEFSDGEYIKWQNEDGTEVFPLWSSESRITKILTFVEELQGAKPVSFSYEYFCEKWVPDLLRNKVSIGPNWAGENLTGTSIDPNELIQRISHA